MNPAEIVNDRSIGGRGFTWMEPMRTAPPMLTDPYGNPIAPYPDPYPSWGDPSKELFMVPREREVSPRDLYLGRPGRSGGWRNLDDDALLGF